METPVQCSMRERWRCRGRRGGRSGVRIFIVEKLVNISYWKTRFITSDIDISIPTFGRSGWFFGIAKTHSIWVALPVAASPFAAYQRTLPPLNRVLYRLYMSNNPYFKTFHSFHDIKNDSRRSAENCYKTLLFHFKSFNYKGRQH